jgi:hypothetical protein
VYNLQVEGVANYFAEGVLVHNCQFLESFEIPRRLTEAVSEVSGNGCAVSVGVLGAAVVTDVLFVGAAVPSGGGTLGALPVLGEVTAAAYTATMVSCGIAGASTVAQQAMFLEGTGDSSAGEGNAVKPKSSNQMQKEVERGQAPKTIERVDKGVDRPGLKEKPHIHLDDGSALNNDGTWKHGGRALTEAEKQWISKSGWKLPQ